MINEVIHPSSGVTFSAYTYTQVYAGAAATPTINGVAVTMAAGSSIAILVKSISSTANVYCIGKQILRAPQVIGG